ncbi:MAG: DUF4272 domain-containing protein [Proteobacteria bacterium]|nr:DUF4272 domain-containing protein [Pseudomonadota bacterium]
MTPVEEAEARKARSQARMAEHGLHDASGLPGVVADPAARLRPKAEAVRRLYALMYVARAGAKGGKAGWRLGRVKRDAAFTRAETAFLTAAHPSQEDCRAMALRVEAALALFWALGWIATMRWPQNRVDPGNFYDLVAKADFLKFVDRSNPRALAEVLDEGDLLLRLKAHLASDAADASLDEAVVRQRLAALTWLAGEGDWDDIAA